MYNVLDVWGSLLQKGKQGVQTTFMCAWDVCGRACLCAFKKKKPNCLFLFFFFFFCSLYVGAFATPVLRRKKGLYCVHATRGTGKAAKKKV